MSWEKVTDFDCQVVVRDRVHIEGCDAITVTAIADNTFVGVKDRGLESLYSKTDAWSVYRYISDENFLIEWLERRRLRCQFEPSSLEQIEMAGMASSKRQAIELIAAGFDIKKFRGES